MADFSILCDLEPVAFTGLEGGADLGVEVDFHRDRIATFCYFIKQPIAIESLHRLRMEKQSISETLASNLEFFMADRGIVQKTLAAKSGIGQTTISLYLNPDRRKDSASGKEKSPTLAKVQSLADALGVELWELLRPLSPAQRNLIHSVEAVIAEHAASHTPAVRKTKPRRARAAPSGKPRRRAA